MKKSRYGEETVVIRVPVSARKHIEEYIKRFEVLGSFKSSDKGLSSFFDLSYQKGFSDGFIKGEECQFVMSYALVGASDDDLKLAIELFRRRVPDIALVSCFDRLSTFLLSSDVDVLEKQVPFSSLLGLTGLR